MSIQIGSTIEHGFDEPLGLMSDCHRRIERFLDTLVLLAEQVQGGRLSESQRDAMDRALRYFASAGPLHNADEEESLFPRLRARGGPEVEQALETAASLEQEHRTAERAHAEVERLGRLWIQEECLEPDDAARLLQVLQDLRAAYARHIATEDQQLFPLAARLLDSDSITQIGREMAERRGLDPDHLPTLNRCTARRLQRDDVSGRHGEGASD